MGFEKTISTSSHPTIRNINRINMLLRTVLCVCLYKSVTPQQKHPYYFQEDSSQAQQAQYYQDQAVYQNSQPADRYKRKQTVSEGYSQNENLDRRYYEKEDVDRRYYEGNYKEEEEDFATKPFSYEYGGADHVLGYQANVRYEGEARPEPPRQEEDYLERKKFVPNYDYKPYARARY